MRVKRWMWLAALPAALALAGCGGTGILPGQGGIGGIGTPGTGTGNPDATLSFRLRGGTLGDFSATDLKAGSNILGFQIQGSQNAGISTNRIVRVATVRFNGLPVAGRTYTIGASGDTGALLRYSEQYSLNNQLKIWDGNSGTIHIDRVTSDHVDGTFQGTLSPTQIATTTMNVSGGEIHVKYQ